MMFDRLLPRRWPSTGRAFAVAVAAPAAVTAVLLLPADIGVAVSALTYVLAVAVAAGLGGLASGMLASVLSFMALHYFFTPPEGLGVPRAQDVVALLAFLMVSVVVGAWISVASAQRLRADLRAAEARVLHQVASQLLTGVSIEAVVKDLARSVIELLGLVRIEIDTTYPEPIVYVQTRGHATGRQAETFPMVARGRTIGRIVVSGSTRRGIGDEERAALRMLTDQVALALDAVGMTWELQSAELEARSNEARTALFASVTHDLRTPLASILASATSLRSPTMRFEPEQEQELLNTICQEAERLNRLVGNLLDLSRIRSGALSPNTEPGSVGELVGSVVGRLGSLVRNHRVSVQVQPGLPPVPIDAVLIDQVVTNLVENAVKYSPLGTEVRLSCSRANGGVRVLVADDGPGIPQEDRERVFEPFVRGRAGVGQGAGLGLAICRAIVEAHGGHIRVEDGAGRGATISFDLPLEHAG